MFRGFMNLWRDLLREAVEDDPLLLLIVILLPFHSLIFVSSSCLSCLLLYFPPFSLPSSIPFLCKQTPFPHPVWFTSFFPQLLFSFSFFPPFVILLFLPFFSYTWSFISMSLPFLPTHLFLTCPSSMRPFPSDALPSQLPSSSTFIHFALPLPSRIYELTFPLSVHLHYPLPLPISLCVAVLSQ